MKKILLTLTLAAFAATQAMPAAAQPQPKKEFQMYQVVMAKRGPNYVNMFSEEGQDIRDQVMETIRKGTREGVIVTAGLVNDETDVEFIIVLDIETKTEAMALVNLSPNVKNGVFTPEIYSWHAWKLD
jgi:uncharacterized protein YciI